MAIFYGDENGNKRSSSPDYWIFLPKEKQSGERQSVGIIYRNKSKNGAEYLKVTMNNGDDVKNRKTYYAYINNDKRQENDPDWNLYLPKDSGSDQQKIVGSIIEVKTKAGRKYLKISISEGIEDKAMKNNEPGVKKN